MFTKGNKIVLLVLCLMLVMLSLSACGPKRDNANGGEQPANSPAASEQTAAPTDNAEASAMPEKPQELAIWADTAEDKLAVLNELTKKYTEKTGIPVKITPIAMNDQPKTLTLDGPAGKGPDLFYQPGIGKLALEGLVQPMNVPEDVLKTYTPESLSALSDGGKLYGLPFVVETYALFYNKDLVPTPPATIADLEQIMKAQTDKANDKYGFLFDATNFYFAWAFMGGNNGYIFKPNGNSFDINDIGLNKEGAVAGVKLIQDWFKQGYLPKGVNGDIAGGLFNQGKVGAIINGPWAVSDSKKQLGDKFAVAPLPKLANGNVPQSFIGVKGWMLSKFSKNPEWATDLAEFLTSADSTLTYFKQTGEIPPVLEVLSNPVLTNDPIVAGFSEQIKHGLPFPNVPELDAVWDPMANALKFAAEGKDVQTVLDEAVKQVQEKIKMMGASK
ncbi:MAG TPA: extracellular solute-binding protein [Bacilli bacterium]